MAMLTCDFPVRDTRAAAIIIRCTHAVHFFNFLRALSALLHDRAVCSFGQHIFGYARVLLDQITAVNRLREMLIYHNTAANVHLVIRVNDALGSRDAVNMRA